MSPDESIRLRWWQFWNISYRNTISSVSVKEDCRLELFKTSDFTGAPLILRAVSRDR